MPSSENVSKKASEQNDPIKPNTINIAIEPIGTKIPVNTFWLFISISERSFLIKIKGEAYKTRNIRLLFNQSGHAFPKQLIIRINITCHP
jgi:hypothetical protein